ncbi:hypothetical protein [Streptomyces sp. AK02-01A]|uniref:hypothetical protein n=1 Tax=Streptomyces sp. AK02-01A TaxID=3028648 RepID=UPI0029A23698|nr:hypothetical protein [Streptomyces sp. AK02-01A]MDX3855402.1 hypothetical protein [Streptomyces sp. AK02-01A]
MRQFSAPGRLVVRIVTSLAVAASAGCMSVGDDEGKQAPSRPADSRGAAVEPDGGTNSGAGVRAPGAARSHPGEDGVEHAGADDKGKDGSPRPSSRAESSPEPSKGARSRPGGPTPPRDEPVPPKEPPRTQPPASQPPAQSPAPDPGPGPDPEPEPEPVDPPTTSPAADMRTALMTMGDGMGMRKEPLASPQAGPV